MLAPELDIGDQVRVGEELICPRPVERCRCARRGCVIGSSARAWFCPKDRRKEPRIPGRLAWFGRGAGAGAFVAFAPGNEQPSKIKVGAAGAPSWALGDLQLEGSGSDDRSRGETVGEIEPEQSPGPRSARR